MNFYKSIKADLLHELRGRGFSRDKLGEGATKKFDKERSCVVLISGMWSHVEIRAGIRFNCVNSRLYEIALRAGWQEDAASVFLLGQTPLFFKGVGSFCKSEADIGVYCPSGSVVKNGDDIKSLTFQMIDSLSKINNIREAVSYFTANECFDPYGCMMIGAAVVSGDSNMLSWARSLPDVDVPLFSNQEIETLADSCEAQLGGAN